MNKNERYLNPLSIFGFRRLFDIEQNKDILISFLNSILEEQNVKHHIKDISYKPAKYVPEFETEEDTALNFCCEGEHGARFIVKFQKQLECFFNRYRVYYLSSPLEDRAGVGTWRFYPDAVYSIGILDFLLEDSGEESNNEPQVSNQLMIRNTKSGKPLFDNLMYIYLEMPNFDKSEHELETELDKWLFILKNISSLQEMPPSFQEPVFKKAFDVLDSTKLQPAEILAYHESLETYARKADDTAHGGRL
ncbi:MAG: PD-(D/E)XK nuclease family transposase [Bacteroidales bacterium]